MEVLFTGISDLVVQHARRQLLRVFGPTGAPPNLVTCHIRWGDKVDEMELVPMADYITAVQ
eukprot:scaffold27032_cov92-Amphora_coffeaeformis.AAC.1